MDEDERNLSDADIEVLANRLQEKLVENFYQNLGSGVWALVWRGIVIILIILAMYGASRGS